MNFNSSSTPLYTFIIIPVMTQIKGDNLVSGQLEIFFLLESLRDL